MALDIDFIAHNSNLKNFNPNFKVLISFIFILVTLIANSPIVSLIIFAATAILIILIAKTPIKDYLQFISIPLLFSIITCTFMLFFLGSGEIIYNTGIFNITIREDSLNLAYSTFLRIVACFQALGFLTLTTPIMETFNVLSKLKIPKIFLEISMLMYNSIFIFLKQFELMTNSQKTRLGYNGVKNSYRSLGLLVSNLFIKSLNRSEALQNSLDSRCYGGEFPVYEK
ncbi:cobalt ECF transporter T component CbiQ [Methanobrevibacter filiformis]|uniref:Cobalt transport protein CbiQ n=1 Tax=Methanobrevibacter filiformis TaxID=55758 RepID=A0A166DM53_9EURY|nr:cobalt ECF transporter T component CbiQ [Methanobrevibacter filiformis]KZX15745.1 cobalt transport protein CbiQ [Methanobrevibacter filiformis]